MDEEAEIKSVYKGMKCTISLKMHLKHKIHKYLRCEAYSSKTCSECGHIKTDLNGNKVYWCYVCPNVSDCDWNGARGILVCFLTKWARIEDTAVAPNGTVVALMGDD